MDMKLVFISVLIPVLCWSNPIANQQQFLQQTQTYGNAAQPPTKSNQQPLQPAGDSSIKAYAISDQQSVKLFYGITWFMMMVIEEAEGITFDKTDIFCHCTIFHKSCLYSKFQLTFDDNQNEVIFKEWKGTQKYLTFLQMKAPAPTTEFRLNFSFVNAMKVQKTTGELIAYSVEDTNPIKNAVEGEFILVDTDLSNYAIFIQKTKTGLKLVGCVRETIYKKEDRGQYKQIILEVAQQYKLSPKEITTQWDVDTNKIRSIFGDDQKGTPNQTQYGYQSQSGYQTQYGYQTEDKTTNTVNYPNGHTQSGFQKQDINLYLLGKSPNEYNNSDSQTQFGIQDDDEKTQALYQNQGSGYPGSPSYLTDKSQTQFGIQNDDGKTQALYQNQGKNV